MKQSITKGDIQKLINKGKRFEALSINAVTGKEAVLKEVESNLSKNAVVIIVH